MQELLGSTSDLFLLLFSSPTFEKYGKNHAKTEKGWEKSQKNLCNTELNYAFIYLKFYIEKEKTQWGTWGSTGRRMQMFCSFPQLVGLPSGELLRGGITSCVSVAARAVIKADFTHVICPGLLPEQGWWGGRVPSWAGNVAAGDSSAAGGELCTLAAVLLPSAPTLLPRGCSFSSWRRSTFATALHGYCPCRREQCGCSPWKGLRALVVY